MTGTPYKRPVSSTFANGTNDAQEHRAPHLENGGYIEGGLCVYYPRHRSATTERDTRDKMAHSYRHRRQYSPGTGAVPCRGGRGTGGRFLASTGSVRRSDGEMKGMRFS